MQGSQGNPGATGSAGATGATGANISPNLASIDSLQVVNGLIVYGPANQPAWTSTTQVTVTNQISLTTYPGTFQTLSMTNFQGLATLVLPNTYPGASMNVSVMVKLGTTSSFSMSALNVATSTGIGSVNVSTGLSTTSYTAVTFTFTAPSNAGQAFSINTGQNPGSDSIYGLTVSTGSALNTSVFGSVAVANALSCKTLNASGDVTATGDLVYGAGGLSVASQLSAINAWKTSGTFASTTTFQNLYTIANNPGSRGFITVTGQLGGPNFGMITCFFEGSSNQSYACLTQIACTGNGQPPSINTTAVCTGGTQTIFLEIPSGYTIQVRTISAFSVNWYVTLL